MQGFLFPLASLIGNLGLLAILFYGGRLAILGTISMGEFVAFITYLAMLIWPMMAIGWVTNLMQRGATSLGRINTLLSERALLPDVTDTAFSPQTPSFTFKTLTFSYPDSGQCRSSKALHHLRTGNSRYRRKDRLREIDHLQTLGKAVSGRRWNLLFCKS